MSAIITPTFRRNAVSDFKAGIDSVDNNYYIGIGRLIPWPNNIGNNSEIISEGMSTFNEPLPQVTLAEEKDVRDELMTLVKVEESETMIPKNLWSENTRRKYKRYDPTDPLTFELEGNLYPCITVSDDKIYICLENNSDANGVIGESINAPHVNNGTFLSASEKVGSFDDRYVWAYIGALDSTSMLDNDQFISISSDVLTNPSDSSPPGSGDDLATAAQTATGGLVYGFKIEESPTVDLDTLDLVLEGIDSTGAKIADVNIMAADGSPVGSTLDSRFTIEGPATDGKIGKLYYTNNSYTNAPVGYKKASVIGYTVDSNGTRTKIDSLKIIPLIAPLEGFGYDIKTHAPAHYIGVYSRFAEGVDGEALTNSAYRQISIIKNPQRRTDDSPDDVENDVIEYRYTDEQAIDCLNYIQISQVDQNLQGFDPGTVISQASTGAKAQIVHVDLGAKKIYYQQQDQYISNFLPFEGPVEATAAGRATPGDLVTDGSNPITISGAYIESLYTSEYIHDTGEVLFVDNRKRINRNQDQIEDLRIVIQF